MCQMPDFELRTVVVGSLPSGVASNARSDGVIVPKDPMMVWDPKVDRNLQTVLDDGLVVAGEHVKTVTIVLDNKDMAEDLAVSTHLKMTTKVFTGLSMGRRLARRDERQYALAISVQLSKDESFGILEEGEIREQPVSWLDGWEKKTQQQHEIKAGHIYVLVYAAVDQPVLGMQRLEIQGERTGAPTAEVMKEGGNTANKTSLADQRGEQKGSGPPVNAPKGPRAMEDLKRRKEHQGKGHDDKRQRRVNPGDDIY